MTTSFKRTALWIAVAMIGVEPGWGIEELAAQVRRIVEIEHRVGGRLGVAALNTASGRHLEYRASEKFPMCSTFKFLVAASVLDRCDKDNENLDRPVYYNPSDLLQYAPITKQHVKEGSMTLGALCGAAIEYSDNTAGNLLLQAIGGPGKLTEYVRSLGDSVTRSDRNEPSLNSAIPGDVRDTTSPQAMLSDMENLLIGHGLSTNSRRQLETWLVANTTGAKRLRAGIPAAWRTGDKTGTGENGATNDIAIVWPPNGAPILVAVYLAESACSLEDRESAIAEVGRLVTNEVHE